MDEVIAKAECYIKGEKSNAEKKARDVKERDTTSSECKNHYPLVTRDRGAFKKLERRPYVPYGAKPQFDDFTLLNARPEGIVREVYSTRLIPDAPAPKGAGMGSDRDGWCKYHRIRGHDTNSCVHLRQEIEKIDTERQAARIEGKQKEIKNLEKKGQTKNKEIDIRCTPFQEASPEKKSQVLLIKNMHDR